MRKLVLIMGLGVALAGCNKTPSTAESAAKTGDIRLENASAEEVARQAAAAEGQNKAQPGEWESSVQIVAMEVPGLPEPLRKQMEAEAKKPAQTMKECKKDDAQTIDFGKFGAAAQNCVFPKYVLADGKIDANMVCKSPVGEVKMTIHGVQTPSAYDITVNQSQPLPGQAAEAKTTIRVTGKRLGDCKA